MRSKYKGEIIGVTLTGLNSIPEPGSRFPSCAIIIFFSIFLSSIVDRKLFVLLYLGTCILITILDVCVALYIML